MRKPPPNTYYYEVDKDGQLVVTAPNSKNEGGLPLGPAIQKTLVAIKRFGWSEGIRRTLFEIGRYVSVQDFDRQMARVQFNSIDKQMQDGKSYKACATCQHSPEAEATFWNNLIGQLKQELANPPAMEQPEAEPEK